MQRHHQFVQPVLFQYQPVGDQWFFPGGSTEFLAYPSSLLQTISIQTFFVIGGSICLFQNQNIMQNNTWISQYCTCMRKTLLIIMLCWFHKKLVVITVSLLLSNLAYYKWQKWVQSKRKTKSVLIFKQNSIGLETTLKRTLFSPYSR